MKTKIIKSTIVTAALMATASAFASTTTSNDFYIRPEAGFSNFQLNNKLSKAFNKDQVDMKQLRKTLKSSVPTGGVVVGKRFGGLGVEMGYSALRSDGNKFLVGSQLSNEATNTDSGVNVAKAKEYARIKNSINNVNLDANYDFYAGNGFHVVPSLGVGYMHSKVSFDKASENVDDKTISDLRHQAKKYANDIQPRAGLNAMYNVSKNFNVTTGVGYQMANNLYRGVTTVKAGFELSM